MELKPDNVSECKRTILLAAAHDSIDESLAFPPLFNSKENRLSYQDVPETIGSIPAFS